MSAENNEFRLPDRSVLRAHPHSIGGPGSGKQSPLLAALGLCRCDAGDNYGQAYFTSVSAETLAAFPAKLQHIRSWADFARYAEGAGERRAESGSEDAEGR
jgi:hypothetical protein